MKRNINDELIKWKRDSVNKPLFLYGPRCVGKTFSILEFGRAYYKNIAYFDTLNNKELKEILEKEKNLDKLIMKLSILCGESIFKGDTLLVFDNLSEEKLIKSFKVFTGEDNMYHVVVISSCVNMINRNFFEGYYYRRMSTLNFFEYLSNTDKMHLIDFIIDSYENNTSMPFHQLAMDTYYEYLSCGGFPEVVAAKVNGATDLEIEAIKKKIMDVLRSDYLSSDNEINVARCEEVLNILPSILIKDNKKFQYGMIRKGARSKEYDDSINTLINNGILNISYRVTDIKGSLNNSKDSDSFKLYYNDVGIFYNKLFLNNVKLMTDMEIRKSLIENDVANNLLRLGYRLYYYQSDGKAEVNFIIQNRNGKIIPLEITSTKSSKSKVLSVFTSKFEIEESIKITEDNFAKRKNVKLIPVYALCCLKDL